MKKFHEKVDKRNRKEMIDFLSNHFRYYTASSWNLSHSYANNIKIYNLGLEEEIKDKLYEMLDVEEFYDELYCMIEDFNYEHKPYRVYINGRSGGYLVLSLDGKGIDEELNFEEFTMEDLRESVGIVQDFDMFCDYFISLCVFTAKNYDVSVETVDVPKQIKVLVTKEG